MARGVVNAYFAGDLGTYSPTESFTIKRLPDSVCG